MACHGGAPWYYKAPRNKRKGKGMSDYTNDQLSKIWEKGFVVGDLDPAVYRTDAANGLMKRSLYGNDGNLGWEVDHICPKEQLKERGVPENRWDDMVNLRPMNAKNNVAKGADYPTYKVAVQFNKDENTPNNVEISNKALIVDKIIQDAIRNNYSQWWST